MSGTQLEKDVQFARHLRENGGIAGREMVLPHPHKAAAQTAPVTPPRQSQQRTPQSGPTLLVIIDGPKAGASVPLTSESITLGRAASNTVVLDDEFVSSHHARIYKDPASGQWAIEDLGSTNGTIVNQQRLNMPMLLPPRMPVRIGATTFELR